MSSIQIAGMLFDDDEDKSHSSNNNKPLNNNASHQKRRTLDSFIDDKTKKEIDQKSKLFLEGGIAMAMRSKSLNSRNSTHSGFNNNNNRTFKGGRTEFNKNPTPPSMINKDRDSTSAPPAISKRRLNSLSSSSTTASTTTSSTHSDSNEEEDSNNFSALINQDLFIQEDIETCMQNKLCPILISTLTKSMNLKHLTKIQSRAMNPILSKSNVLMKSETGSGKTLAYLIPMIQMLYQHSLEQKITREDGTFAIIMAPTRELCLQVDKVLKKITCNLPYLVCGGIMGGEKRKSEKERLRKGITILVATPGRLEDHLKSTQSFKCDQLKYLILDEADILLDFGFEQKVKNIYNMIVERKFNSLNQTSSQTTREDISNSIQKILVSATLHSKIQTLAQNIDIMNALYVGYGSNGEFIEKSYNLLTDKLPSNVFTIPAHLTQYYMIVPSQFRLVMLAGFLREKTTETNFENDSLGSSNDHAATPSGKIIVFLSCCDSVEFHYHFFTYFQTRYKFMREYVTNTFKKKKHQSGSSDQGITTNHTQHVDAISNTETTQYRQAVKYENGEPLIRVPIFKLHGDIDQKERTLIYKQFSESKEGILFCTDVAARGLDLPSVKWIVQYDPPGNPKEYLHRIGRTARMGVQGNAIMFLHPHEELYKKLLEKYKLKIHEMKGEKCLESIILSFRRKSLRDPIEAASWLQNIFEEEMSKAGKENTEIYSLAVNSYFSYIKYYSTHGSDVKYIFHPNNLHLGHLAKSFALKDSPSKIKQRQLTLGVKPLSVKKQELEKVYSMKDQLPKREFLKRLKDVKGSSSIKSNTDKKRKRLSDEEASEEEMENHDEKGYESFSDEEVSEEEENHHHDSIMDLKDDHTPMESSSQRQGTSKIKVRRGMNTASMATTTATTSTTTSETVVVESRPSNPSRTGKSFIGISFGKPVNSDGTEANGSINAWSFKSESESHEPAHVGASNSGSSNSNSSNGGSSNSNNNDTTTSSSTNSKKTIPTRLAMTSTLTPLQLRQSELKKKKLTPNERMKLYRDYEKGKIQPSRPKIVIPEGLRKNQKHKNKSLESSSNELGGVSFDESRVIHKPLSEYSQLLSRYATEGDGTARMMMNSMSEFDSSVAANNHVGRIHSTTTQDQRRGGSFFQKNKGGASFQKKKRKF
ncbi:hypothetical protein C9374_007708 [Naegleria lovaniensis]|uniref:ATP-dependent RNA helicase n=1 Tax=Naegleria lovaniensis TaxID=51637 RepID=A0AA88GLP7_NAELO|nr:uncharacterized protein C9374_007708 [Naegleria lovaniensis]KAG2379070.1 hypothetical protein C9374_007708 [Naegleria lovaniensis]